MTLDNLVSVHFYLLAMWQDVGCLCLQRCLLIASTLSDSSGKLEWQQCPPQPLVESFHELLIGSSSILSQPNKLPLFSNRPCLRLVNISQAWFSFQCVYGQMSRCVHDFCMLKHGWFCHKIKGACRTNCLCLRTEDQLLPWHIPQIWTQKKQFITWQVFCTLISIPQSQKSNENRPFETAEATVNGGKDLTFGAIQYRFPAVLWVPMWGWKSTPMQYI